jgi:hypothetical protein
MEEPLKRKTTLAQLFNRSVTLHCGNRINKTMATYGMLIGIYDLTEPGLGVEPSNASRLIMILNKQFQKQCLILNTNEQYIYEVCDAAHKVIKNLSPCIEIKKIASCAYAMSFAQIIQTMKMAPLGEKRIERNYMMGLIHMGWENRHMYSLSYDLPKRHEIIKQNWLKESPFYPGHTIQ